MNFYIKNGILLVVALGTLAGAFYVSNLSYAKLTKWERAQGRLMHWMIDEEYYEDPRIAFDYHGREYNFIEPGYKEDKGVKISLGEKWTVIFPPGQPRKAQLYRLGWILGAPAGLTVTGVVLLLIFVTALYRRSKGLTNPTVEEAIAMRRNKFPQD